MVIYHVIRVFLFELVKLPIFLMISPFIILAYFLSHICPEIDFRCFNVRQTYKIVKLRENSKEFHKWTGKRIK